MKNLMLLTLLCSFGLTSCETEIEKVNSSSINNYPQLKNLFVDPPSEYRSAVFLSIHVQD